MLHINNKYNHGFERPTRLICTKRLYFNKMHSNLELHIYKWITQNKTIV